MHAAVTRVPSVIPHFTCPVCRGRDKRIEKITHRSHDRRLPLEHVITSRACAAGRGRVTAEIDQLLQVPMLHTTAASQEETSMSAHASKGR